MMDRLVEEETPDKHYSNRNRRKWSQVNRKLVQFPVEMWISGVNDPEFWEGSRSQLLGICLHLSLMLSSKTMQYYIIKLTRLVLHKEVRFADAFHFLTYRAAVISLPFPLLQESSLFFIIKAQTLHTTKIGVGDQMSTFEAKVCWNILTSKPWTNQELTLWVFKRPRHDRSAHSIFSNNVT